MTNKQAVLSTSNRSQTDPDGGFYRKNFKYTTLIFLLEIYNINIVNFKQKEKYNKKYNYSNAI